MRICCPLSSVTAEPSGSAPGTARARPPTLRAASKTVTLRPARAWATPPAMPAHPPPPPAAVPALSTAPPGPPACPEAGRAGAPAKVGQGRAGGDATVGRPYLLHAPQRLHLPRQPELAQRC